MPTEHDPPPPSLIARLATVPRGAVRPRVVAAAAALVLAAPVATWGGAALAEQAARRAAAAIAAADAPTIAAAAGQARQRRELAGPLDRPTLGGTLDALARALPRDATLAAAGRDAAGRLSIEVATADPDRLRAALRRDPATARLRDAGQRRGDAALVVTLAEP